MLALDFAVLGSVAFTVLLLASARTFVRALRYAGEVGAGGVAVSTIFLISLAAIDTAFVVLLLRALKLTMQSQGMAG